MNSQAIAKTATVAALALMFAGCSGMSHKEKDTAVGATGGAVAGAVVAGPVGAVVVALAALSSAMRWARTIRPKVDLVLPAPIRLSNVE